MENVQDVIMIPTEWNKQGGREMSMFGKPEITFCQNNNLQNVYDRYCSPNSCYPDTCGPNCMPVNCRPGPAGECHPIVCRPGGHGDHYCRPDH